MIRKSMIRYYITDRETLGGAEALLQAVERECAAGVDWIQLREKNLAARDLEVLASRVLKHMREFEPRPKLLLHSRADVAVAVGADGVHLASGAQALSAGEVRALWPAALIGVSCHELEEVALAEAQGADFAVFGPVFEKSGLPNQHGLERLRDACHRSAAARPPLPVLALGGVTAENASLCLEAGAAGVAGIRMFQG